MKTKEELAQVIGGAMMANRFGVSGGASAIEGHTFECTSIFA